jgi:acyl carrier protein
VVDQEFRREASPEGEHGTVHHRTEGALIEGGEMISERLKRIILKALQLEDFDIQDETTAGMVPGWDSLSHVRVIIAIEENYGIRFKTLEVIRLKNVGELQRLIDAKGG